jgi:hypothetical protein
MGTGKRRINSVVRVLLIVLVAELATDRVVALVREIDPAVEPELVIVPAVERELATDPAVVRAQLIVPVAGELGHDPAVARELATAQLRGHLAVLAKTKSVTAAHPRDQVPLLAAGEDLAAEAETMRDRAAAEAAIAWAAAE